MCTFTRALVVLSSAIVLSSAARADVIHVPSEVPTLGQAIDLAVDGDVVLLAPGDYPGVAIAGKAIALVGDGSAHLTSLTVRNLPDGAMVLLQNLTLGPPSAGSSIPALVCRDSAGSILIRNCSGLGAAGFSMTFTLIASGATGLLIKNCQDVVAVDCSFTGGAGAAVEDEQYQYYATAGGTGIDVTGTEVALYGVTAQGGAGGDVDDTISHGGGDGGDGLLNDTGTVHASGCTFVGGHGGHGDCSIFTGCGAGGKGGDAIAQSGSESALSLRADQYAPGGGGFGGDGTPAAGGQAKNISAGTLLEFPAAHRSLALTSPVREGQVATLTVSGLAGDLAFVQVGLQPRWLFKPFLQGVYLLDTPLLTLYLGSLSGSQLSLQSTMPELGPGILDIPVHVQLIIGGGSGYLLGPAVQQVLLDAAE